MKSQGTSKAGEKAYMVHGGWVFSRADGDRHYVEARRVAELYGLRPHNCILVNEADELRGYDLNPYIHLYPDETGKYEL